MIIFSICFIPASMFSDIESYLQTCSRMNSHKMDSIRGALTYLEERGTHLLMSSFVGIGGYNIVFENEDHMSVTRIFFQRNVLTQTEDTLKSQRILHDHPTDAILPILDVVCSKDQHTGSNWIITRTPKIVPLSLVTSPEMAGELFRTAIKTVDYLADNNLFCLDLKLNNFGKIIGSSPSKYVYIDPDFATLKPMETCYSQTFTKNQLMDGLQLAEDIGLLGFSMLGYAFIIALLRFGKIPESDLYGGVLSAEFYRNFLKVYKYLLGIHFYQQFFITKHEYETYFGEGSSNEYMSLSEEEIERISKLTDINRDDYSTPQNRVRRIIDAGIYSEEDILVTPNLTRLVQCTDFNPSRINPALVLALFRRSEGKTVYPDDPYPPYDDDLYRLSLCLYHQTKTVFLYPEREIIPPPPDFEPPPPSSSAATSVITVLPSSTPTSSATTTA